MDVTHGTRFRFPGSSPHAFQCLNSAHIIITVHIHVDPSPCLRLVGLRISRGQIPQLYRYRTTTKWEGGESKESEKKKRETRLVDPKALLFMAYRL